MDNQNNEFMSIFNDGQVDVELAKKNIGEKNIQQLDSNDNNLSERPQFNPLGTPIQEDISEYSSSVTIKNPMNNVTLNSAILNESDDEQDTLIEENDSIDNNVWNFSTEKEKPKYGTHNNELNDKDQQINDDEYLLKIFIGNNYDKFTNKFFNFSALLFNALYFIYRKMYLLGLIILVINTIMINILPLDIYFCCYIPSCIVFGIVFNKIYVINAKHKIKTIKKMNKDDVEEVCVLLGRTSLIATILLMIMYSIITCAVMGINIISSVFFYDVGPKSTGTEHKAEVFFDAIKSYSNSSAMQRDLKGQGIYIAGDKIYKYILIPTTLEKKYTTCILKKGSIDWNSSSNEILKPNSTSCLDYMGDFVNNYVREINNMKKDEIDKIVIPESASIKINNNGEILSESYVTLDNKKCILNNENKIICK